MNAHANPEAARYAGDMGVSRLVAEVMADADVFAVTRLLIDLLHHPGSGRRDRRAERGRVVHAFVEAPVPQDRGDSPAEAVAEAAVGHRFVDQRQGDGAAITVVIVSATVVGCREAVVAVGTAIERERRERQFALALRVPFI